MRSSRNNSEEDNSPRRGGKKANALFRKYASLDKPDMMDAAGVERFCLDIGVDACDCAILAFCFICQAETMGQFTRVEFTRGLHALKASSIAQIQACVPKWHALFQQMDTLRPLYRYVFTYVLEDGHKQLPIDVALDYWELLLRHVQPPLKAEWFSYVREVLLPRSRELKIYRDLWNSIFDFLCCVGYSEAKNFNADESAWPTTIDEFVEWLHASGRFSMTS